MEIVEKMKEYAIDKNVPIMQDEGIEFMLDFIKTYGCTSILEIGTAIGYSAIRMCECNEKIHVTSIERDEERYHEACANVKEARLEDRITLILGDALETEITGNFDFIFIDAAKAQYQKFFERYAPLLTQNGYIFTDNLGFHGLVAHPENAQSRGVRALVRKIGNYVEWLKNNDEYVTHFMELGDGVAITQRKSLAVKGMIFDMDGLLLDTERVSQKGWNYAAQHFNLPFPDNFHQVILGKTSKLIEEIYYQYTDGSVKYEDFRAVLLDFVETYHQQEGTRPMKGAVSLLEYCKENGIKVIVATSTYQERARLQLTRAGLIDYFDIIVSGDMVKRSKPNPDIFLKAVEELGLSKLDCMVFEDSNAGVEAAIRGGIRVCMVPDMSIVNELSKQRSFRMFDSLEEATDFFRSVNE